MFWLYAGTHEIITSLDLFCLHKSPLSPSFPPPPSPGTHWSVKVDPFTYSRIFYKLTHMSCTLTPFIRATYPEIQKCWVSRKFPGLTGRPSAIFEEHPSSLCSWSHTSLTPTLRPPSSEDLGLYWNCPDDPGWSPHVKVLNFIIVSAKPCKVTTRGSGG